MRTPVFILAFAAILFPTIICKARSTDDDGHILIALWKEYNNAAGNDRPEDILSVLDRIKAEASVRKLAWDYYDACDRYRSVKESQNWKLRKELDKQFEKEISDFGVPVAVFYSERWEKISDWKKFVEKNAEELKAGYNPGFYENDYRTGGRDCSEVLCKMICNDYDYALWSIYFKDKSSSKELVQRYATELRLLEEVETLQTRFDELCLKKDTKQEDCIKLREDCRRFISAAGKLSGEHRAFGFSLKTPQTIIDNLEEQSLSCRIEDGTLIIQARNLTGANVRMKDENGRMVFSTYVDNDARSFFIVDTLETQLPLLDDGTYSLLCTSGKVASEFEYNRHSLSASLRRDSKHCSIFVADQKSGKPLESCTVTLRFNGKSISEHLELRDGFTPLPENIEKTILAQREKDRYILQISARSEYGKLIETEDIRLYKDYVSEENDGLEKKLKAALLIDRKAFNPGDTIHFKAILYAGYHKHTLCKAGIEVKAELFDPGNSLIAEQKLATNQFGSVAGDFILPSSGRGGPYRIAIVANGHTIESVYITVDEFVLPSFVLEWDEMKDQHLPLDSLVVTGSLKSLSGHGLNSAKCEYSILYNNKSKKGELQVDASGRFGITLVPGIDEPDISRIFDISIHVTDGTGETSEFSKRIYLFPKPEEESKTFCFEDIEGRDIAVKLTAGYRTTWVAVDLYGIGDVLLESRLVRIEPKDGLASEIISFPFKDEYPELVSLHLVFFQNSLVYSHTLNARKPQPEYRIPIDFTGFTDKALPGTEYKLTFRTAPFTECAASIFDVSTETVRANQWTRITPKPIEYYGPGYVSECGGERSYRTDIYNRGRMLKASAANLEEEEILPFMLAETTNDTDELPANIRSDFANTICWEPFIRSDAQGNASLEFTTSDKLSTYYVQLFVHDKDFNNSVLRKEILVSIPVKVAVMEPQFLYENDNYTARITLSNSLGNDIRGKVSIRFFDGKDYRNAGLISGEGKDVTIPSHGGSSFDFSIVCPEGIADLGVLASFETDGDEYGSDAVFVRIPVKKACQTITEAHSAVLFEGVDKSALIDRLRGQFTGVSGQDAEVREISILRMLTDAVPDRIEPESDNAISLSEALLSDHLLEKMSIGRMTEKQRDDIRRKLNECINPDGGYAWFKGMKSSPLVTACILIQAKEYGLPVSADAIKYLDNGYFNRKDKLYGPLFLSLGQYAYVRSLYGDVPFDAKTVPSKEMKKFRNALKQYLLPSGVRGLEGNALAKTRRILTIKALQSNPTLAEAWGLKAGRKMEKSIVADTESILQYAQKHIDGGWYYPNAVMPWRGLMESELDAHVLLCKLLDSGEGLTEDKMKDARQKADGIRLWMMLQKETQNWDSDPSYIYALSEVLKGSESLLNTKVIALSATSTKPLSDIKESGNGFSAERRYLKNGKEIQEGDSLHIGDRITAEYRIWSQENRSFVKLTAFRPAGLRPVNQLSACYGNQYTDVKADRTEYWYDVFPEEDIIVREDFFITQEGSFQSPAITVESFYAPHYRANDKYSGPLFSVR